MTLLFLFVSLIEALGIGLIGPFISLAVNPDSIRQNHWLDRIYTGFHLSSENQFLMLFGVVVIIAFCLKGILSFNAQKWIFHFGFNQQGELSGQLMQLYLSAPYTYHLKTNSAIIIQTIINETNTFANALMMPLLTSVSNGVVILGLVLLLISTNAMATFMITGLLLVGFMLITSLKQRLKKLGEEGAEARTEAIRAINHGLGGLKETRIVGCEFYFQQKLEEQAKRYGEKAAQAASLSILPRYSMEAVLMIFLIIFSVVSVSLNQGGSQNLSSVLGIFALASIRLLPATANLLSGINTVRYNSYALDKIYFQFKELGESTSFANEGSQSINTLEIKRRPGISFHDQVVLHNVTYRYPSAEINSLDGISLEIKKGQSIGLIGKSGSGKTTLVDVILGLLTPQDGDIQVDDQSIYTNLRSWQNLIGYVPQSIFLTDDSLERNIAFGVPDRLIDSERLHKAIQAAQLSELVEQIPNGIQTMVGERGVLLSGGQRQRIGIARALYHEREFLVFDEATAALDNETEGLVTEAIKSLSGIKTMIIIAHRLSTIEHCDRIYAIEQGKVVKSGSYQEVVEAR
jgi:ABC-type bacteriocin/lantibiotic exporter with double-glycine peptidase domain